MNGAIAQPSSVSARPLRLGFLGVGWIGRHRMEAMRATGLVEAAAIADTSGEMMAAAAAAAPGARRFEDLAGLLRQDLDGVVIATPSAQHAAQAIQALEAGVAVFCQKPLGRNAEEVRAVVDAARAADRLLGVDLSYRHTAGMEMIREILKGEGLGQVMAVDLTFHNAYGPDKPWFYDKALSGGGCVIDLGVHLVDLALWALDFPEITKVSSQLMAQGRRLVPKMQPPGDEDVEDYAVATLELKSGAVIRLACSWRLHAGTDCVIDATFYGDAGGAALRNLGGSFYDFSAEHFTGTARHILAEPPDAWGGRAAVRWAEQLARDRCFDPAAERLVDVAAALDRIYDAA